jgi:hypothetical protein
MKKILLAMITIVMLMSPFLAVTNATVIHEKNNALSYTTSTNWSGYAVETNLNSPQTGVVTDVKATWTVPAIIGNAKNTYSSFWVGIDGYSGTSNTVEQIGTDSDTNNRGQAVYYAWYEMYPAYPVNLALTIKPGDSITADVSYNIQTNKFTLTIDDTTSGGHFVTVQASSTSMERSSAEWVAEAPSSMKGVLPLANFGSVTFTGCSVTMTSGTGTITSENWVNDPLLMVSQKMAKGRLVTTTIAQPYGLSSDGSGFSVQRLNA